MKNLFKETLPKTSELLSKIINDQDIFNLSELFNTEKYDFLRAEKKSTKRKIFRLLSEVDDDAFESYEGFVTWVSQETSKAFTGSQKELSKALFAKLKELKALFEQEATAAIDLEGERAKTYVASTIDGWKTRLFNWASSTSTSAEGFYNTASMASNPVSYIQKRIDDLKTDASFFGVIKTLLLKVAKFFAEILFPPTPPAATAVKGSTAPVRSNSLPSAAPTAPAAAAPAAAAPTAAPAAAAPAHGADHAASSGGMLSNLANMASSVFSLFKGSRSASPVQESSESTNSSHQSLSL